LAPSDFFLFGCVKGKLMGYCAETPPEPLHAVEDGLSGIEKVMLEDVFLS
jgi:hypothetical protein